MRLPWRVSLEYLCVELEEDEHGGLARPELNAYDSLDSDLLDALHTLGLEVLAKLHGQAGGDRLLLEVLQHSVEARADFDVQHLFFLAVPDFEQIVLFVDVVYVRQPELPQPTSSLTISDAAPPLPQPNPKWTVSVCT